MVIAGIIKVKEYGIRLGEGMQQISFKEQEGEGLRKIPTTLMQNSGNDAAFTAQQAYKVLTQCKPAKSNLSQIPPELSKGKGKGKTQKMCQLINLLLCLFLSLPCPACNVTPQPRQLLCLGNGDAICIAITTCDALAFPKDLALALHHKLLCL